MIQSIRGSPIPSKRALENFSERSSSSALGYSSHTQNDEKPLKAVPHISHVSGKTEDAVSLSTFKEYCAKKEIDLTEGPTKNKIMKKIAAVSSQIKTFKNELEGIEMYSAFS